MSRMVTPPAGQSTSSVPVAHDKIAQRAYEKWCKRGQPHGTHVQDWLEAERELQTEFGRNPSMGSRR